MSCVCILTPVVIAAWPAFSAAVVAAATSLGYTIVQEGIQQGQTSKVSETGERKVNLEIEQSEIVTNQLGRDQRIQVVAAATPLGYTIVQEGIQQGQTSKVSETGERKVNLEIEQSEIVTNQLGRDQRIQVTRGGVTVTFSRDARGKASICVTGPGHSDEELRTIGGELSQRVVQKYVHRRLMDEIHARQFVIVEEEVDENNAIRLKVRHWDG